MVTHQEERYFARMDSAISEKAQTIFPFLKEGLTLDIGCGSGELTRLMNLSGHPAVGLDASPESVVECARHGVAALLGYSHNIAELFPSQTLQNVVACSIFHEVYSYGDGTPNSEHTLEALSTTVSQIHEALTPGGRLIIRDGVMPANWDETQTIQFTDPEGIPSLRKYLDMIPYRGEGERKVNLTVVDEMTATGNAASVMEFLYTYTWGTEVYPRETQELYGVFTQADYCVFLENHGFTILATDSYLQPGYEENLVAKALIFNAAGKQVLFPDSNQILVCEKK